MKTGDTVWLHPGPGDRREAVAAHVDLLSSNGRSIALRLHDRPSWLRVADGVLLRKDDGRIEMLLLREAAKGGAAGPWVDAISGSPYEIEDVKP